MSSPLEAAFAFASHNDWARVVPAARQALAHDPQSAHAHALLALGLSQLEQAREAVDAARRAVALDPELAFAHFVLGRALLAYDDAPAAERAARESLRLDPDADGYSLLAQALARRHQWLGALDAANRGLELDPEHAGSANIRVLALGQLGRAEEADAAVSGTLALDPDNTYAHANRGLLLLRQSKPEEALESFREALRLDPTNDMARAGIVEALKARKGLYRVFLRYSFWVGSLTAGGRWAVIIGMFVLARIGRVALRANPELLPVLGPLLGLYFLFVLATWIGDPLSNLLLRLDPFGRLALTRDELIASNLVGGCLALTVVAVLMLVLTLAPGWFFLGVCSVFMLIPIGGAFKGAGTRAWRPLLAGLVVLATLAAATIVLGFAESELVVWTLLGLIFGSIAYGWIANYLVIKYA
jgi:tetratricopeptide (TPR) repeat protein